MHATTKKQITKISLVGLIGIFATALLYMADLTYYPAFYGTMLAFPDADMGVLNFIMTGSQIAATLAAFAVIPLMRHVRKKVLLLGSIAIFAVFAICSPLVSNVYYVAVMRTLSGLGFGGLMGVSTSLIQQVYRSNPKRRDQLVGWYNGFISFAGALNGFIGGILAVISWDMVFRYYWIAIPVFILVLVFVPNTPADEDDQGFAREMATADAPDADASSAGWNGTFPKVLAAACAYAVISLIYMGCGSGQLSVLVIELGVGDEATVGVITALVGVAGFFVGFAFAPLFHRFKRMLPAFFLGINCIGILIYVIAPASAVWITIGFCCDCIAYVLGLSYYMVYASESVPPAKASTAITIITIGMTVGSFISPFVVTWIQTALNTTSIIAIYPVLLICVAIGFVLSVILGLRSKRLGESYGDLQQVNAQEG